MQLRLASVDSRAHIVVSATATHCDVIDVARASNDSLPSDPMACFARWDDLRALASKASVASTNIPLERLDCPVPRPRQMFAVGLNYKRHAEEMGSPIPSQPLIFAKFQSSLNAPFAEIQIVGDTVDYESEVVVVIGSGGRNISQSTAWDHVAGLCAGQDVSDRKLQYAGTPPQFSMGKSRTGFSPIGPWVADMAGVEERNALRIGCSVNGEQRQDTVITDMIFSIDQIVSYLSSICELYPGDIIYTGSPAGVGHGFKPPVYLKSGDVVETTLEGVGTMRHRFV